MAGPKAILPLIVVAQFACVSLWFAGNGVMDSLAMEYDLPSTFVGHLTSAVQFGFILGTLFYAVLAFADRYSPSLVFFISAILASLTNLGLIIASGNVEIMLASRFLTGFFLAGIYPVGMKIAADYFDKDLGKALGYLLGALVLGTAFPHLLKSIIGTVDWHNVIIVISVLAIMGGMLIFFLVPDGPYRKRGLRFERKALLKIFHDNNLRAASFGYFGHMWELYAFWTFIPLVLTSLITSLNEQPGTASQFTFYIIAAGSISCVLGGYLSRRMGSYRVAFLALSFSSLCCAFSPLIFTLNPAFIFVFLLFWGMVVIMDSPQFSTLVAQSAPADSKASALTIVNCIGFSITIISIQLLNMLSGYVAIQWLFVFLFPGPALGLLALLQWNVRDRIM